MDSDKFLKGMKNTIIILVLAFSLVEIQPIKIAFASNNDLNIKNVKYKPDKKVKATIGEREIENEILSAVNTNITMFQVNLNGECYGYIPNQDEGKKILNKIGQLYLDEINVDSDRLIQVDVEGKLDYTKAFASSSVLDDNEEIAQRIYDDNKKSEMLKVTVKAVDEQKEIIPHETKVEKSNEIYLGQSKVVKGEVGEKQVLKEIKYVNGKKCEERALDEIVINEPKDTVVYKGVKDPIQDNHAFLYKPTRGWTITSNFGPRWGKNHNGMDIAGNTGDPVLATFDGVVKQRYYDSGYGNVIFLEHENGIETIYGHLSGFNIEVGKEVKKGDLIGYVGSTGISTGPHLHFELRVNGIAVNPSKYIQ